MCGAASDRKKLLHTQKAALWKPTTNLPGNRSPLPWLKRVGLQLNVNNLFNEDDAYVTRRVQGTNPEVVRRIRVREPRTWRLTATFDF